jgi:Transglutaminase-like superfamily
MRDSIALLLLVLSLYLAPVVACADAYPTPVETTWMTVLLNGRKIGHEEIQRQQIGNTVTTTQTLVMDIQRDKKSVPYTNISRSVETVDGKPLSFSMDTTISTTSNKIEGKRLSDGQLQLSTTVAGDTRQSITTWPTDAVLVEGQRIAMVAASQHPGSHYKLPVYNQSSQQVMNLAIDVLGNEQVALPDHVETLSHQRETLESANAKQIVDLWLDEQGNIRKGSLSFFGKPLEMIACDEACADASTQSLNMMDSATVDSPRLITQEMLKDFLSYRIHVTNKAVMKPFIDTDEQATFDLGNGDWQINVYRSQIDMQEPPTPADTQPNAWLQSDSPEIKQLAAIATGNAENKMHVMGNLSAFVSKYLSHRGLNIGYASAVDVAIDRKGDCAQFAVLLAAMARAEGIPARVVVGMLYTDQYDNKFRVFVPHAWVIAWLGDRWRSFDAATLHFDTGHIALDTGDGNPWHFFNATNEFGNIQIDSVKTFTELYNMPMSGTMVNTVSGASGR